MEGMKERRRIVWSLHVMVRRPRWHRTDLHRLSRSGSGKVARESCKVAASVRGGGVVVHFLG